MKYISVLLVSVLCLTSSFSQDKEDNSPYRLKAGIDAPIIIGGAGLGFLGLKVLRSKETLDSAFVVTLSPEDVNRIDRSATRNFSENMGTYSDIALYTSFALPFFLYADKHVQSDGLKVTVLYLETMAIMANAYVWGVSATSRIRPYVYNPEVPLELKLRKGTTNSFYAGHPAAAAASSFFAAKVFSDYHPDSKLRTWFWIGAIIPPAVVGYFRYKDGQHFLTDNLVGIPLGATIGILVPHLHKKDKEQRASIFPAPGGLGMVYRF